ncbi:uncharacterized protein LOC121405005 [Drosophila obscura]|uniref:uncharacterized protein LOC121405005 n=1 Tax=Drosophila obscura TaxID=7282 RepID=UPI001BB10B10|nr:uncharacterized protein LOC121405005 [Drosophila obscura]
MQRSEQQIFFEKYTSFEPAEIAKAVSYVHGEDKRIIQHNMKEFSALKEINSPFCLIMDEWFVHETICCIPNWKMLVKAARCIDGSFYRTLYLYLVPNETIQETEEDSEGEDELKISKRRVYDGLALILEYMETQVPAVLKHFLAIVSDYNKVNDMSVQFAVSKGYPCVWDITHLRADMVHRGYLATPLYNLYEYVEFTADTYQRNIAACLNVFEENENPHSDVLGQELDQMKRLLKRFFTFHPLGKLRLNGVKSDGPGAGSVGGDGGGGGAGSGAGAEEGRAAKNAQETAGKPASGIPACAPVKPGRTAAD